MNLRVELLSARKIPEKGLIRFLCVSCDQNFRLEALKTQKILPEKHFFLLYIFIFIFFLNGETNRDYWFPSTRHCNASFPVSSRDCLSSSYEDYLRRCWIEKLFHFTIEIGSRYNLLSINKRQAVRWNNQCSEFHLGVVRLLLSISAKLIIASNEKYDSFTPITFPNYLK